MLPSKNTILVLLAALMGSSLLFEFSSLDIQLQNLFYQHETGQWLLNRDNTTLKLLLYDGVKVLYLLFIIVLMITLLFFRKTAPQRKSQKIA